MEGERERGKEKRLPPLSRRLQRIADCVRPGSRAADIGTDHGYLPIYLYRTGRASHVYACDVREGPLARAAAHVKDYGCTAGVTLRRGDGLSCLEAGEADTVILAGMGGALICRILSEGGHLFEKESPLRLILSPQSEYWRVRRYLQQHACIIEDEHMLVDEGKYYVIMDGVYDPRREAEPYTEAEYYGGKRLIEKKDPVLRRYLTERRALLEQIAGQAAGDPGRMEELNRERALAAQVLSGLCEESRTAPG